MDVTIQTANAKTVTAEAIAPAEPKYNRKLRAEKSASFFCSLFLTYYFMLMYIDK